MPLSRQQAFDRTEGFYIEVGSIKSAQVRNLVDVVDFFRKHASGTEGIGSFEIVNINERIRFVVKHNDSMYLGSYFRQVMQWDIDATSVGNCLHYDLILKAWSST